jgi:hypothetical protein
MPWEFFGPPIGPSGPAPGDVTTYFSRVEQPLPISVRGILNSIAHGLANLKGYHFREFDERKISNSDAHTYYVPDDTLDVHEARQLGIEGLGDLFGGIVPAACMKTKIITHQVLESAVRPLDWPVRFTEAVRDVVLPGYSVFSANDGMRAAAKLLKVGPVRIKNPMCGSGKGQVVVDSMGELERFLAAYSASDLARFGLVLEINLAQVATMNFGTISVDDMTISYLGTQRMTRNRHDQLEYGGSDLTFVRGGWDAIYQIDYIPSEMRAGLECAKLFDRAAMGLMGLVASRRNYDVGIGVDAAGKNRTGVFESSWRPGAASTAEVAALTEFKRHPSLEVVQASSAREFGMPSGIRSGAFVNYQGIDEEGGSIMYYTMVTRTMGGENTFEVFNLNPLMQDI